MPRDARHNVNGSVMREWWLYHVEEPLSRLPVNWDTFFTHAWLTFSLLALMSGGNAGW